MLGKNQRELLRHYAELFHDYNDMERRIFVIRLYPYRHFSREAGGGAGHRITIEIEYENYDTEGKRLIAQCSSMESGERKAQEVARHLLSLGVPREHIKAKRPVPLKVRGLNI